MTPVGGSRHYQGAGLGAAAGWACPSCGADNQGPLEQGCQLCGAGKPGKKVVEDTPNQQQGDHATYWATQHPHSSIADAYRAGYLDGMRALREAQSIPAPPADVATLTPEGRRARTLIAALTAFRDQVLVEGPEEIASGEWCTAEEVDQLITEISETHRRMELTHG